MSYSLLPQGEGLPRRHRPLDVGRASTTQRAGSTRRLCAGVDEEGTELGGLGRGAEDLGHDRAHPQRLLDDGIEVPVVVARADRGGEALTVLAAPRIPRALRDGHRDAAPVQ